MNNYRAALLTAFFSIISLPSAIARDSSPPTVADSAIASSCLGLSAVAYGTRIVACTIAIETKAFSGHDLAAAYLNRGQAYRSMGDQPRGEADYKEAVRLLGRTPAAGALDSEDFVRRGMGRHSLGDVERALTDYNDAIRLDAGAARGRLDRGVLLAARKAELRASIIDFDRALALLPDTVDTLILRGDAFASLGEQGRALADLDRAVELAPENPRALLVRGVINARRGETQLAFADYTMALVINPRYVDALVNRAAIYSSIGYAAKAIVDLDIAIALSPKNALAFYNRGYAHFARREYELAIADYSRSIELDGRMAWAYANRCLTRTVLGLDLAAALADCDEALKLQPDNLQTRESRGFVFLKRGENGIAFREYDSALRTDPNRPLALYGRGLARIGNGDLKGGEHDRQAARSLMPTVDSEFLTYGLK